MGPPSRPWSSRDSGTLTLVALENVVNLLYRRPELYDVVYPEPDQSTPRFCRAVIAEQLGREPASILDVGCGTGRDLEVLAQHCGDCVGIDANPAMIEYMRAARPSLPCSVADMTTARLGRTFDALVCLGSVLTYALTDADVDATLDTFAAHAHADTVLVLDLFNATSYLPGASTTDREFTVDLAGAPATARVRFDFDRRRQLLLRRRTWSLADGSVEHDYCEYGMFFPTELAYRLKLAGFRVTALFDNKERRPSDLSGPTLYVVARRDS